MALDKNYNLDEDVQESFSFKVLGTEYSFKQLSTEEMDKLQGLKEEKAIREYLYQFITPKDPKGTPFTEIANRMLAPHWKNFLTMVRAEMAVTV